MNGKALKRRREALRYSQAQLAALLHVHTMTVSRWERGQHKVPESVALLVQHLRPKKKSKQ
jgi:transcriptional regulator with XRE-family HTH domain